MDPLSTPAQNTLAATGGAPSTKPPPPSSNLAHKPSSSFLDSPVFKSLASPPVVSRPSASAAFAPHIPHPPSSSSSSGGSLNLYRPYSSGGSGGPVPRTDVKMEWGLGPLQRSSMFSTSTTSSTSVTMSSSGLVTSSRGKKKAKK